MIRIPCPGCDKTLRIPENMVGRTVACPQCKTKFRVPPPTAINDDEERVTTELRAKRPPAAPKKERRPIADENRRSAKRSHTPVENEVDELEEIEEQEEVARANRRTDDTDDEQPRRSGRMKKKKIRIKSGSRWGRWWSGLSPFDKFATGAYAVCLVLAGLGVLFPPIILVPAFMCVLILLLGQVMLIRAAFEEGAAVGCAFLLVPLFPLYFIITHFEESKKPLLFLLSSIVLLGGSVICAGIGSALWHALLPSTRLPW